MCTDTTRAAHLLHSLPGRMRVHLPGWSGQGKQALEARVRQLPGVRQVQANPLTGNVLIFFDSPKLDPGTLLAILQTTAFPERGSLPVSAPVPRLTPPAQPRPLGSRFLRRLARLLVACGKIVLQVVAQVLDLTWEEETAPSTRTGVLRLLGALAGLSLLGGRRLAGRPVPFPLLPGLARITSLLAFLEKLPFFRALLRRLLGRETATLLFHGTDLLARFLTGNPLSLALAAGEACWSLLTLSAPASLAAC